MNRLPLLVLLLASLVACQTLRPGGSVRAIPSVGSVAGEYDNHEQVWSAHEAAAAVPPPHVAVTIEATPREDWSLWHVSLDATPSIAAHWAMQRVVAGDGSALLVPHRAMVATPAAGSAFDPKQWAPLDACALHGADAATGMRLAADPAACAVLAPGIGAEAALLPLVIEHAGEWLHLRLYVDQARGADAREDLRKVQVFEGWAAINGAGPSAVADANDWHMNRKLRLGSEGGRAALAWRDGKPSGYSLALERLTYREGNVPVLKLSVVEDTSGRTLAYAWANPEATRIGINLGWVQVGIERSGTSPGR
ncbi:MAG: hypothetical protein ACHP7D_05010 [Lysobacterales bacterium]